MDVASLADLLHETAEHHGSYEKRSPQPHDWWDWYAAYMKAMSESGCAGVASSIAVMVGEQVVANRSSSSSSASVLGDRLDECRNQLRATLPIGRVVGPADVAALAVHLMTNTAAHRRDLRHRRRPAAPLADNVQIYREDSHDAL